MTQFSRANHYVPQFYLKNWVGYRNAIWYYRLLVSHEKVPIWSAGTPTSTAVQDSLYVRLENDKEADDFEAWLNQKVETPAEKSLLNIVSGSKPTKQDIDNLIVLLAAQFARTPARFCKQMPFYNKIIPQAMKSALQEASANMKSFAKTGIRQSIKVDPTKEYQQFFPSRIRLAHATKSNNAVLELDVLIGRGLWLSEVYRVTMHLTDILKQHDWFFIKTAPGVKLCTSDDPVICLNYYDPQHYDFDGGIGRNGCEIFFPLSPKYVMATHIGNSRGMEKFQSNPLFSFLMQKFTIEHAFRYVYAAKPWDEIASCRCRTVNKEAYAQEEDFWQHWNDDQIQAERSLLLRN